jgi:putative Ca2+/H+ antiporter (TMEM165/GDT1 family)
MVDFGVIAIVFGLIFVGELPDKSAIASLVLSTRFPWRWVFTGVAAAFLVHVIIAVAAGSLLQLLPHRAVEIVVMVLFLVGAVLIWREADDEDGERDAEMAQDEAEISDVPATAGFAKVASLGFATIFVAEWGDLTQIMTANLAAKYDDPWSVGIGATLALWAVGLLAMLGGATLLRVLPMKAICRIAAVAMLALATYTGLGVAGVV